MKRDIPFSSNSSPSKKPFCEPKPPKVTDPLVAAFDDLNASWNEAEADFAAMRVPVCISHQVSLSTFGPPDDPPEGETRICLEWTRHQNQWRICWVKNTQRYSQDWWEVESKPIPECPMEIRVEMAEELRPLRHKMKEGRNKYLPKVLDAITAIKEALAD